MAGIVFPYRVARSQARVRLFCLPSAFAAAVIYRSWPALFDAHVDVCPVELPGRGVRYGEPLVTKMDDLVGALVDAIRPLVDRPVAFFGHSMGARVAFELARVFGDRATHLFVSASTSPDRTRDRRISHLPEAEFWQAVRDLGGTPDAVLRDEELKTLLLPIGRADFALIEDYRAKPPLEAPCPITVLAGTADRTTPLDETWGWRELAPRGFRHVALPAEHFYLESNRDAVLRVIADDLRRFEAA